LSCSVDSDNEFIDILTNLWNLSDMAPPPPMLKVRKGKEVITPTAVQTHGDFITWQQEKSNIEQIQNAQESRKGKKGIEEERSKNFFSDVVNWNNHHFASKRCE
jgi:hypothetical protein